MLRIVQAPNPVLSDKAKPVENIDRSVKKLIKDMEEALINASDPEGVGLAAPQVGKSLQIFLIRQTPASKTLVFINPVIEKFIEDQDDLDSGSKETEDEESKSVQLEGCLSLYNIWGDVKRHPGVILTYTDEENKAHKRKFTGFISIIIQHEFDHLQGILFPKRVLEQKRTMYRSKKNEKGESVFEEIEL
jgi:peptide deformylase